MDTRTEHNGEAWAIAGLLTGRYGQFALARAAGKAADAERNGDGASSAIWYGVIAHLRRTI